MTYPWNGILEGGETILWQGPPTHEFSISHNATTIMLLKLTFSGFAIIWIAASGAAGVWFWFIVLIHFSAVICITTYAILRITITCHYNKYTPSLRRAVIGLSNPWVIPRLGKIRMTPNTKPRSHHKYTVDFDPSGKSMLQPSRAQRLTRIDDALKVFHLMQQIQKETP